MVSHNSGVNVSYCYQRLRAALLTYISPLTVDMVLTRTLAAVRLSPASLECDRLDEVIEAAMLSLRMFVTAERLPELMLQLADLIDEAATHGQAHTRH